MSVESQGGTISDLEHLKDVLHSYWDVIIESVTTMAEPYHIPSPHFRREDANKRFFRSIFHPSSCIPSLLPPQRALLLLDYDLQLYILSQLPEQNVLHLQFSIFC